MLKYCTLSAPQGAWNKSQMIDLEVRKTQNGKSKEEFM